MKDMSTLPDTIKSMKPLLDRDFVAYLNYAIAQERTKIMGRNLDPDREPTEWLQVLGVVRQGTYAELGKDLREDIQAIMYVLRMPDAESQRLLLEKTVETLPTWDVRRFHKVMMGKGQGGGDGERARWW